MFTFLFLAVHVWIISDFLLTTGHLLVW